MLLSVLDSQVLEAVKKKMQPVAMVKVQRLEMEFEAKKMMEMVQARATDEEEEEIGGGVSDLADPPLFLLLLCTSAKFWR